MKVYLPVKYSNREVCIICFFLSSTGKKPRNELLINFKFQPKKKTEIEIL